MINLASLLKEYWKKLTKITDLVSKRKYSLTLIFFERQKTIGQSTN